MKLYSVVQQTSIPVTSLPNIEVQSIQTDSRHVKANDLFIAIKGQKFDGHSALSEVLAKKPAIVIIQNDFCLSPDVKIPESTFIIRVSDTRQAWDELSNNFNNRPSHDLRMFGVTGTNGKTTTVYMLEMILNKQSTPTGVLGTIDHHLGQTKWATELTTPDPTIFHQRLRQFVSAGAKAAAVEVSSIAVHQHRGMSVEYDAGILTNFTQDHLDYHGSMDEYWRCKRYFFTDVIARQKTNKTAAILNVDDARISALADELKYPVWKFGQAKSDLQIIPKDQNFTHSTATLKSVWGEVELELKAIGLHNLYNAAGALAAIASQGFDFKQAVHALADFTGAPGRLQSVPSHHLGLEVFIDYAHTPDALEKVLKFLRYIRDTSKSSSRIITVFGCGGDRDRSKRPLMAEIAMKHSDYVVVTSDNPRTEEPQKIIDEILQVIPTAQQGKKVYMDVDRRGGIKQAISLAKTGDVVLIAGKGHEDYQIIGQQKIHFSDYETAKEILNGFESEA